MQKPGNKYPLQGFNSSRSVLQRHMQSPQLQPHGGNVQRVGGIMFAAREKEIQLYQTWQFHSAFPAPVSLSGGKALPLPVHRSSPLPRLPRVSANCVWDGDACQLGIELKLPYASEQLSDGDDFLPLVLIWPATERGRIVQRFWSRPAPAEVPVPVPQ